MCVTVLVSSLNFRRIHRLITSWPINMTDIADIINAYNGQCLREAIKNKLEIVDELLMNPWINPNLVDSDGSTALHDACRWNNASAVTKLIATGGVDLNKMDCHGYSPVMWAAKMGREEVLEIMVAKEGVVVTGLVDIMEAAEEAVCDLGSG